MKQGRAVNILEMIRMNVSHRAITLRDYDNPVSRPVRGVTRIHLRNGCEGGHHADNALFWTEIKSVIREY